jgi:hypothetical protein
MRFILSILLLTSSSFVLADVMDDLPKNNRYNYVKKISAAGNLSVFDQYEAQDSSKIIFLCIPNSFSFKVQALWDVVISNKQEATKLAKSTCSEQYSRFVLLGYGVKVENRY